MTDRRIDPARDKRSAITHVYAAVQAPTWAAPNLDGLADVLRDLSWLPPGPVRLHWPAMPGLPAADERAILAILRAAQLETAEAARPVTVFIDPS